MESISNDSIIYTIQDFVSNRDCDHMINLAKDKIQPALVSDDKEGVISEGRTGQNCWISHDFDVITKSLSKRIASLVNMPLENAESFQVIYYDKDQEYRQHYDGWLFDNSDKSRRNMKIGGQRIITALVYLNTVPEGGGTKFTKLDIEVAAEKGKLLIFHNTYQNTSKTLYYR